MKNKNSSSRHCSNTIVSGFFFGQFDEFNQPVKRSKFEYPYSYDGFVIWRGGENNECNGTIYSDRLLQWDRNKYNELSKKHFGNEAHIWFNRDPEKIEAFLRDWTNDQNLRLILVMEYCNVSTSA